MMVIGFVIFIRLVFGKELLLEKSAEYGILNNDFEFRCITNTPKTNAIRWNLNESNTALVTGAGCTLSPGSDTRFSYACEGDKYLLKIPGDNMTQDLNNTHWRCRDTNGGIYSRKLLLVLVKQDKNETVAATTGTSFSETSYSHTELPILTTDASNKKRKSRNETTKNHSVSGKELILVVSATGSVLLLVVAIVIFKLISKYRNTDIPEDNEGKLEQNGIDPLDDQESVSNGELRPTSGDVIENELYASSDFQPGTPCSVDRDGVIDKAESGSSDDEDDHIVIADIFQKQYKAQGESSSDVISLTKINDNEKRPIPVPRRIVTAKSVK